MHCLPASSITSILDVALSCAQPPCSPLLVVTYTGWYLYQSSSHLEAAPNHSVNTHFARRLCFGESVHSNMSSPLPLVTFLFYLFSCESATASALPWPTEEHHHSTRSPWAGHAPRSTDSTTKTGMPVWKIVVISLGMFFGVMALGMVGGALEVLLHTRKKVADPDPADLDFGPRGADAEAEEGGEKEVQEREDTDDDGATAVEGEGSANGGDDNEKQGNRFSWQDEQGVQMEVWNENEDDPSREMDRGASQGLEHGAHDDTSAEYPQQPVPAYVGDQYEAGHEDGQYYPQYHHEDVGAYSEGHEEGHGESEYHHQQHDAGDVYNGHEHETVEPHEEVQDLHGQRMTRYEPWVPQMEDEFQEIPLPEHGSQSETTHQQHPAEYI